MSLPGQGYIQVHGIQASSLTPGLQDLGAIPDVTLPINEVIGVHGISSHAMSLDFPSNKVISLIKVNITGAGFDSLWFPLIGSVGLLLPISGNVSGSTYAYFTVQSAARGRQVNVQLVNETVGASVTLANLVITVKAHLYSYPW